MKVMKISELLIICIVFINNDNNEKILLLFSLKLLFEGNESFWGYSKVK